MLIYTAITSLDGYVADRDGRWDWSVPDDAVHAAVNELERPIGTHLYGRRMYEVLVAWETMPTEGQPAAIGEYAQIWRAAEKVVFSSTLTGVSSARTRIERTFDPDAVRSLVAAAGSDVSVGGPGLAGQALRAGLVDELHLFVSPAVVGGGTAALGAGLRLDLDLLDERRFPNGVVHLHYAVRH